MKAAAFGNDSLIRKIAGGQGLDHHFDQELESLVRVTDELDVAAGPYES